MKQTEGFKSKMSFREIMARADVGVMLVVIVLGILFAAFTDSFFSSYNIFNILRIASLYVFVALAQALVVVTGGVSLAIGAIGCFAGLTIGLTMEVFGIPLFPSILITTVLAVIIGYLHGVIITKLKLDAFVVTLATQFILIGLVLGITKGFPFVNLPKNITVFGRGGVGVIPYLAILAFVVLLIMAYFFKFTAVGRKILATGGNMEAARLSGINTNRIIIISNILSAVFAALAALLFTLRLGSIQSNLGSDWLLISFAVAIIAGTGDGKFSALGIGAAAIMMVLIKNGLIMLKVDIYFEQAFLGVIILFAVAIESLRAIANKRAMLRQVVEDEKIQIFKEESK